MKNRNEIRKIKRNNAKLYPIYKMFSWELTFAYEFTGAIVASFFSILGGLLLNVLNVKNAFLVIGLLGLVSIIITLNYMKTRFGLKPEEYAEEDIEF